METMEIPCGRCSEFRQRFEAAGFRVLGCDPAPAAGMCTLRYEPAGSAASAPAVPVAPVAPVAAPAPAKSAVAGKTRRRRNR